MCAKDCGVGELLLPWHVILGTANDAFVKSREFWRIFIVRYGGVRIQLDMQPKSVLVYENTKLTDDIIVQRVSENDVTAGTTCARLSDALRIAQYDATTPHVCKCSQYHQIVHEFVSSSAR